MGQRIAAADKIFTLFKGQLSYRIQGVETKEVDLELRSISTAKAGGVFLAPLLTKTKLEA
jgi:hypothetical protein